MQPKSLEELSKAISTAPEHYMYHSYSAADLADAIARAW